MFCQAAICQCILSFAIFLRFLFWFYIIALYCFLCFFMFLHSRSVQHLASLISWFEGVGARCLRRAEEWKEGHHGPWQSCQLQPYQIHSTCKKTGPQSRNLWGETDDHNVVDQIWSKGIWDNARHHKWVAIHCHDPQSFSSSLGQCFPVPTMIRTFLCGSNQSHERFHSEQAVSDFDVVEPCRSKPKSDTVHGDNNSFLTFDLLHTRRASWI